MPEPTLCCPVGGYCDRCDLLVGLDGLRVIDVARDDHDALTVTVESEPSVTGCWSCGVVAHAHGRVEVRLVDAPAFGRPVRIVWRAVEASLRPIEARESRAVASPEASSKHCVTPTSAS